MTAQELIAWTREELGTDKRVAAILGKQHAGELPPVDFRAALDAESKRLTQAVRAYQKANPDAVEPSSGRQWVPPRGSSRGYYVPGKVRR